MDTELSTEDDDRESCTDPSGDRGRVLALVLSQGPLPSSLAAGEAEADHSADRGGEDRAWRGG